MYVIADGRFGGLELTIHRDPAGAIADIDSWTQFTSLENARSAHIFRCRGCSFSTAGTGDEAGTLCLPSTLETFDVAVLPDPPAATSSVRARMRGNVYLAEVDAVLYGFDQRHASDEACDVDVYVWSTPSIEDTSWQTLYASTSNIGVRPSSYSAAASNLHINIEAGTYYAFGIGWNCTAENRWSNVDTPPALGFGVTAGAFVFDNSYGGFDRDHVPANIQTDPATYPQHITVYGLG
ncbi:MAG: hypothetical protein ACJAYU_004390 [Bradymonadia bacterium]|jgi:hypothetical protein